MKPQMIRELVSYTAIGILGIVLLGTIWYLRAKFRNLLLLMPPDFESGSVRVPRPQDRRGVDDPPVYCKTDDDPPPDYSSLQFPDIFVIKKIEPPPTYGSVLVVKPATPPAFT